MLHLFLRLEDMLVEANKHLVTIDHLLYAENFGTILVPGRGDPDGEQRDYLSDGLKHAELGSDVEVSLNALASNLGSASMARLDLADAEHNMSELVRALEARVEELKGGGVT